MKKDKSDVDISLSSRQGDINIGFIFFWISKMILL